MGRRLLLEAPHHHLFWTLTVYDKQTGRQFATDQAKAALRSPFELKD